MNDRRREAHNPFAARSARLHDHVVYQVDDDDELSRERRSVLERLHGRRRVLEVGSSIGNFTAALAAAGHEVTAVEGDPRAAATARARGHRVLEGDVELPDVWSQAPGPFDAVVFMHLLEHLADPWSALERARSRLAPGGAVITLLPNVAAWRVRRALFFRGRFDYEDRGILDRTHLRFFTLASGIELHRASGFTHVEWESVDERAPFEPFLYHRLRRRRLAHLYGERMRSRFPNLCTEVFCFEARP